MATEPDSRLNKLRSHAAVLFDEEAADRETDLSLWQRLIRFLVFVGRSFVRNRCPVRASALAYTTLLGLVPVLAMAISISTSLLKTEKGEKQIEQLINTAIDKFAPQLGLKSEGGEDNRKQISGVISSSIKQVQSGTLGATAGVALVFIAISLLSTIENTLNDIWGVPRGRSWMSRVIYYWAVVTLGPILILFALGLNAGPYFEVTRQLLVEFPILGKIVYTLLPVLVLAFTFATFYFLMPNTKVEWRAALIGGLIAGLLLHFNSLFSTIYFGQVVRNSKLWGGLGTVPVFLIGLYFSWMILLFGAQIAYAYQNRRAYFQEKQAENIHQRGREFVAMRLMTCIARCFEKGERAPTATQLADALFVPSRLIGKISEPLLARQLVIEVAAVKNGEVGLAPGRPLEQISCQDIIDAMRAGLGEDVPTKQDEMRSGVAETLEKIHKAENQVAGHITLQEMIQNGVSPKV